MTFLELLSQGRRSGILLNKIQALLIFYPYKAPYFKMLNDARVASACSYVRTCRRVRNSKQIAIIRDFHVYIRVNSTILGVIRRNFHSCPTELKVLISNWDPHTVDLIQKLEAMQRRAARFVCRNYSPYSTVTTILKNLEWDTLQLRRKAARLTMMYKIVNG